MLPLRFREVSVLSTWAGFASEVFSVSSRALGLCALFLPAPVLVIGVPRPAAGMDSHDPAGFHGVDSNVPALTSGFSCAFSSQPLLVTVATSLPSLLTFQRTDLGFH